MPVAFGITIGASIPMTALRPACASAQPTISLGSDNRSSDFSWRDPPSQSSTASPLGLFSQPKSMPRKRKPSALDALLLARPESLAQDELADLSGPCLRERIIAEFNDSRQLEFAEAALEKLQKSLARQGRTRLANDNRDGNFAPFFIGGRDDGAFEDLGVRKDGFLHLQ